MAILNPGSQITIVIPAYNREETIARTLESIDAQTQKPAQVILVDNASTDGTHAIMRRWAAARPYVRVQTEPRRGACAARNLGLSCVETAYTMFFDSDDVMLPDHVADFEAAIRLHPDAEILGRDIVTQFISGRRRRLYFHAGKTTEGTIYHHLFCGCLSTQRILARTELFRQVGGWDEDLDGWNDFELGVRLLLTSPEVIDIGGEPSVITYQQVRSITGTRFSAHPERWEKSLFKIRDEIAASPRYSRLAPLVEARAMVLAADYAREAKWLEKEEADHAKHCAESLFGNVIGLTSNRFAARSVYLHQLLLGRMARVPSRLLLFPFKKL